MNTTRRYFELKNKIVEAINRAELPPVMADAALREVRGQVLQAMERELREDANVETTRSGDGSDPFRHGCAVPPPLGHQGEASEGRHQGEARDEKGE